MKPKFAVLSYNPLWEYTRGVHLIGQTPVLFLPLAFEPKSPESVKETDPCFELLLQHRGTLQKIIVFSGKKESGALEIITLFASAFEDARDRLFFVLCDHDLEEKEGLLRSLGINHLQWMVFSDSHERCQETPVLFGYLHQFLRQH